NPLTSGSSGLASSPASAFARSAVPFSNSARSASGIATPLGGTLFCVGGGWANDTALRTMSENGKSDRRDMGTGRQPRTRPFLERKVGELLDRRGPLVLPDERLTH